MKTPFNKEAVSITKGFHKFGIVEETNSDTSNEETNSDTSNNDTNLDVLDDDRPVDSEFNHGSNDDDDEDDEDDDI